MLETKYDLFGYGLYFVARLRDHENDDDNLNTLFKKQQLIYLTDDVERILIQKSFLKFNIKSLSKNTLNSFLWFLLEMHRLQIFPFKVEKLFHCLPEYIESSIQSSDDRLGKSIFLKLTENIIPIIIDKNLQRIFRTILEETVCKEPDNDITEDSIVNQFTKSTWQQLIYPPFIIEQKTFRDDAEDLFSIVDNEENWNRRLNNLNKNSLGLEGLAGLGLGMLRAQNV